MRLGGPLFREYANPDEWVHWLELADTLFNLGGLCLEWIRKQGPDLRRSEQAEETFGEAVEVRGENCTVNVMRKMTKGFSCSHSCWFLRSELVCWAPTMKLRHKLGRCLICHDPYHGLGREA